MDNFKFEDLEKGKKEWKKQQNPKVVDRIKRFGGTIYNPDGTPLISHVVVQTTYSDKWIVSSEFSTNSDCTNMNYDELIYYEFNGNGCFAYGTYTHATTNPTQAGTYTNVGYYYYGFDTSVSGEVTTTKDTYAGATDCSGTATTATVILDTYSLTCTVPVTVVTANNPEYAYSYLTTSQPIYDDYSPFTNELPGISVINYPKDDPSGDREYAFYMDWNH